MLQGASLGHRATCLDVVAQTEPRLRSSITAVTMGTHQHEHRLRPIVLAVGRLQQGATHSQESEAKLRNQLQIHEIG